jgi:hypothetical protein
VTGRSRFAFSLFLLGATLFFLLQTLALPPLPRLVPLLVIIPTVALMAAQLVLDWRCGDVLQQGARHYAGVLWVGIMLGMISIGGLQWSPPAYTFLYLKVAAKKSWMPSIATAGGVWLLSAALLSLAGS